MAQMWVRTMWKTKINRREFSVINLVASLIKIGSNEPVVPTFDENTAQTTVSKKRFLEVAIFGDTIDLLNTDRNFAAHLCLCWVTP